MKFPASQHELEAAGYRLNHQSYCLGRNCSELLYWYHTPAGKMMPFSKRPGEPGMTLEPHFVSCKSAQQFRKEKKA